MDLCLFKSNIAIIWHYEISQEYPDCYFCHFFKKTYFVCTHLKGLTETLQMSTAKNVFIEKTHTKNGHSFGRKKSYLGLCNVRNPKIANLLQ